MNKNFLVSGLITTVINVLLNTAAYIFILKEFYRSHSAISEECMKQLHRPSDQLIGWAMVITSLAMGFLIMIVIKWLGARTFASGLKNGFIIALLFWGSVNFGLYASSNFFSQASVFVDYICSVTAMTISGAIAAWLLGQDRSTSNSQ
jgi:hypothetical protein